MINNVSATIIINEDFSDNNYDGWTINYGVANVSNGKLVLSDTACANYASFYLSCFSQLTYTFPELSNFDFSWELNITEAGENVYVTVQNGSNHYDWYYWGYGAGYQHLFYNAADEYEYNILEPLTGLHTYKIEARDETISFYMDGVLKNVSYRPLVFTVEKINIEVLTDRIEVWIPENYPYWDAHWEYQMANVSTTTWDNFILDDLVPPTPNNFSVAYSYNCNTTVSHENVLWSGRIAIIMAIIAIISFYKIYSSMGIVGAMYFLIVILLLWAVVPAIMGAGQDTTTTRCNRGLDVLDATGNEDAWQMLSHGNITANRTTVYNQTYTATTEDYLLDPIVGRIKFISTGHIYSGD